MALAPRLDLRQTQSLVMRSRSGTVRWIDSIHDFARLDKIRFQD